MLPPRSLLISLLLATVTQGRKHDPDNSDDESPYSDYSRSGSNNNQASSIEWLNPAPGVSVQAGQSLTATWRVDRPIYSPSFALCTGPQPSDCGKESWPEITDNGDGTFSTILTMPVIAQSEMGGLFLTMTNDEGVSSSSPGFSVVGGTGAGNAYVAAAGVAANSASGNLAGQDPTMSTTIEQDSKTGVRMVPTATATANPTVSEGRMLTATPGPQPTYPISVAAPTSMVQSDQVQAQAQAQQPLLQPSYSLPTTTPLSAVQAQAQAQSDTSTTSHHSSKPSIIAIVLPLTFCGLILIAALLYCARSKMFRNSGLGKSKKGDDDLEGRDWQEIIKEKARASSAASASSVGVEVREQKLEEEENPYRGYTDSALSPSPKKDSHHDDHSSRGRHKSGSRCLTPVSYRGHGDEQIRVRETEREYFTSLPRGVRYDRDRSGHGHRSRPRPSRGERIHSDKSARHYEGRDRDRQRDTEREYYTTSRRSSSGLGGVYDPYGYDHGGSRTTSSYGCGYDDLVLDTKKRDSRTSREGREIRERQQSNHDRYRHHDEHPPSTHRDRDRHSSSSYDARPHPVQTDSFGPLTNPHDTFLRPQSLTSASPFSNPSATASIAQPQRRPLPNPTAEVAGTRDPTSISQRGKIGAPPHISGGMKDAEEDWDLDLDLMGEGRYRSGEEGMDELYESLRIAIGRE
nr:uncharacterized protein CI109_002182 [Kwoniella shandongensis]KAA5529290.1 hypothetical protein CI109_002182 [Kwoniella shandongensis]